MTNLNERMLPDGKIEPATVSIQGGCASDLAVAMTWPINFKTRYFCINRKTSNKLTCALLAFSRVHYSKEEVLTQDAEPKLSMTSF